MAEEGIEEKIQLPLVGDLVQARVAEADDLAFGVGRQRDLGGNRERQPQAGSADGFPEPRMGLHAHHDPVLDEGELRVLDIGETGGLGRSL